jgi:hypothetical protein
MTPHDSTGDLFDARAARDAGIAVAADHADAVIPEWGEYAYQLFVQYARDHAEFLTEKAREYAEDRGLPLPPDKRAWGRVPIRAAKAGIVSKIGYALATDPKVHCRPSTLWRSLVR